MSVNRLLAIMLALLALSGGLSVFYASKATCSACIGQFCGSSAECPPGCFCAKEIAAPTGRCLGD